MKWTEVINSSDIKIAFNVLLKGKSKCEVFDLFGSVDREKSRKALRMRASGCSLTPESFFHFPRGKVLRYRTEETRIGDGPLFIVANAAR